MHDVDENLRTIVNPGGDWILGSMVGIMFREMRYDSTSVHATAASMCRHLKYSLIIRTGMMSTRK